MANATVATKTVDIPSQADMLRLSIGESVYPKSYIAELQGEADEAAAKIATGEVKAFDDTDRLFLALEGEAD